MSSFADKLKICRQAYGWTQDMLAEKLNTTKQVISHYERGDRTPKVDVAANYSKVLNVPVNYLVNDLISFRLWDHESYIEDYFAANYADRFHLVTIHGIDPRIASDYEKVSATIRSQREQKEKLSAFPGKELAFSDIELLSAFHNADDSTKEAIRLLLKVK